MGRPYTLNDSLRVHDKAVMDWLGGCLINYGEIAGVTRNPWPILSVFASPDRAFAETANFLVRTGFIAGNTPEAQRYNASYEEWPVFPLPIISVVRQDPMFEPELAGVPKFMTRDFVDPETGAFLPYQWPARYRTTYRFTIWSLKRATQAFVLEWFYNQLGQVGMGNREVLLDVDHGQPFGIVKSALRFDSSVDLSDIEGPSQRYIRSELSLALRTNVFRESPAVVDPSRRADPVYSIQLQNNMVAAYPQGNEGHEEYYPDSGMHTTNNLFTFGGWDEKVSTLWPVEGNAEVSRAYDVDPQDARGLDMSVTASTDVVPLACRINIPNVPLGGVSIWMASANFKSSETFSLVARQYDALGAETTILSQDYDPSALPTAWGQLCTFTMSDQAKFEWAVAGAGIASDVSMSSVDIRQCFFTLGVVPAAYGIVGPLRYYTWANLERRPYLIVAQLPDVVAAAGHATVDNDQSAPSFVSGQPFLTTSVGIVIMSMPLNDSLTLRIPAEITPLAVYALAFDGPALPNSIQP
jgi:hypothetical protein